MFIKLSNYKVLL